MQLFPWSNEAKHLLYFSRSVSDGNSAGHVVVGPYLKKQSEIATPKYAGEKQNKSSNYLNTIDKVCCILRCILDLRAPFNYVQIYQYNGNYQGIFLELSFYMVISQISNFVLFSLVYVCLCVHRRLEYISK